jgi:hypothetical protein
MWYNGIVMTVNKVIELSWEFYSSIKLLLRGVHIVPCYTYFLFLMKIISTISNHIIFGCLSKWASKLSHWTHINQCMCGITYPMIWELEMHMYDDSYNSILDKLDSWLIPFNKVTLFQFIILPQLYIGFSWFILRPTRFIVHWLLVWISGNCISPIGCI